MKIAGIVGLVYIALLTGLAIGDVGEMSCQKSELVTWTLPVVVCLSYVVAFVSGRLSK